MKCIKLDIHFRIKRLIYIYICSDKVSNLGIETHLVQFDAFDQEAPKKIYDYISKKYKKPSC